MPFPSVPSPPLLSRARSRGWLARVSETSNPSSFSSVKLTPGAVSIHTVSSVERGPGLLSLSWEGELNWAAISAPFSHPWPTDRPSE